MKARGENAVWSMVLVYRVRRRGRLLPEWSSIYTMDTEGREEWSLKEWDQCHKKRSMSTLLLLFSCIVSCSYKKGVDIRALRTFICQVAGSRWLQNRYAKIFCLNLRNCILYTYIAQRKQCIRQIDYKNDKLIFCLEACIRPAGHGQGKPIVVYHCLQLDGIIGTYSFN